jgi:endogenous inhibitor of DNA gyrase (YacG/DUF329 family)
VEILRKNMIKLLCRKCNKEYEVKNYRAFTSSYCSNKCKRSVQFNGSSWNKGKKLTKEHKNKLRLAKIGTHRSEETKQKISNYFRGEKHPRWKGGITPINSRIRKTREYVLWRKSVFERDNFTCIFCGQRGGKLNADHIKPFSLFPELRFAIDNGRTLCIDCHRKTDTWGYNVNYYKE